MPGAPPNGAGTGAWRWKGCEGRGGNTWPVGGAQRSDVLTFLQYAVPGGPDDFPRTNFFVLSRFWRS